MVRANLDGRKTQTRRIAKHIPHKNNPYCNEDGIAVACPYGKPGDLLWCRETWAPHADMPGQYIYRADPGGDYQDTVTPDFRWRPSIFMPRRACRIVLEIEETRVEPLHYITEKDAQREGLESVSMSSFGGWRNYLYKTSFPRRGTKLTDEQHRIVGYQSAIRSYQSLWESINGPGSWAANPWVWVIEYRVILPTVRKSHDTGPMADMRRAAREAAKRLEQMAANRVVFTPNP